MDYEKMYKEAQERARNLYPGVHSHNKAMLEQIFPELREDEDERIREWLVNYFKAAGKSWIHRDISPEQILAYLEKQKEPENTSASTMAPSCWAEEPFFQKEQKPKAKAKSPLSPHELYDAKIEGISQGRQDVLDHPEQFGLQKPAEWSEDTIRKAVKEVGLTQHQIDWFKNNVFPPKPEWSEEALNVMNLVYRCIRKVLAEFAVYTENEELLESREETVCYYSQRCAEKILKSLRPQPSWKPSEEQMKALEAATVRYQSTGLNSLYEDLKKL